MTVVEWLPAESPSGSRGRLGGDRPGRGASSMPVKLRLLAELQRAAEGSAPCMTTDPGLWVSENWRERRTAARLCVGCPVFDQCRAAAEAEPVEVWGVWAGREYFDITARWERSELVVSELDGARLHRLAEAARDSRPGSTVRNELAGELARLRQSGYGVGTLARAAGMSRHAVTSASTRGYRTVQVRAKLPERDPDAARLAWLRDLVDSSGRGWRRADPELVGERDRLVRELRDRDPGLWSWSRLGELAGLSAPATGQVLRRGSTTPTPRPVRSVVIAAEVQARSGDPRVQRLLELRALLSDAAGRAYRAERAERARLVVELSRTDSSFWSGRHLAVAAGTSRAWVTTVVKAALGTRDGRQAAG